VDSATVLAHRALWSFGLLLLFLIFVKRPQNLWAPIRTPKTAGLLVLAGISLAAQWIAYLLAITSGRLVDMSLGYYLYPLVVALLGVLVLGERLSIYRVLAFAVAAIGVGLRIASFGGIPPLALALAVSFAIYSIVKKKIQLDSAQSVFFETLLMAPFALIYLAVPGTVVPSRIPVGSFTTHLLLAGGGVVTVSTLLLFASGAKKIPVFAVGFLQYIAPTIVLLLGVFAYGERFGQADLVLFGFIWGAIAIYSVPGLKSLRRAKTP
jgi:chloramphenicol-sensitive protein RarD